MIDRKKRRGRFRLSLSLSLWPNRRAPRRMAMAAFLGASLFSGLPWAFGQAPAVDVTITADDTRLFPGQKTTVRVFAQIDGSVEPNASGIFSWFVDLLNSSGDTISADYVNLKMLASDNFPPTTSTGVSAGADRKGIRNTFFLTNPSAGKASPVELLSVTVTAAAPGRATFRVQAGSTAPDDDFIVSRIGGGAPFTGGDYALAILSLEVAPVELLIDLEIGSAPGGGVQIDFVPLAGFDHTVEFRNDLGFGGWQSLPGAPHNAGSVVDSATGQPRRFYRAILIPQ